MAGRASIRPPVVAALSLPVVDDQPTQRALEQMQDAIQNLQTLVRSLLARVEALEAGP